MTAPTTDQPVRLTEVGPRDGLQNERTPIPTARKIEFINMLSHSGVAEIEVTSFVSSRWVPQLEDADEVLRSINRVEGVIYSALVPNEKGLERAIEAQADKIAIFTAASEAFNQRNINCTIAESIDRFIPVVKQAHAEGLLVRGYISCVVACPYQGLISPAQVREVVERLRELGVDEIDLGDTIGIAVPTDIKRLFEEVATVLPPVEVALHLHDTYGTGLACALTAYELGVRRFDASVGGLGGCPYAPGAAGNLATEDLVYCFSGMGIPTGTDLAAFFGAGRLIQEALGRDLPGRVFRAAHGGQCDLEDHQ